MVSTPRSKPGAGLDVNPEAHAGRPLVDLEGPRSSPLAAGGDLVPGLVNHPLKHLVSFVSYQVVLLPAIGQPLAIDRSLRPPQCRINSESSPHRLGHTV